MVALNAEFVARSRSGSRTISARKFLQRLSHDRPQRRRDVDRIRIPGLPPRSGSAFVEFARREGDYALAGVAAVITLDENGTIADARLGLCSVGPAPVRPQAAEALLRGQRPGNEAWAAAATASSPYWTNHSQIFMALPTIAVTLLAS